MSTATHPLAQRAIDVVCSIWGTTSEDITGPGRDQWRSEARFVVISLLVSARLSMTEASRMVGRRHHGSHQMASMKALMESNAEYKRRVLLARANFNTQSQ